MSCQWSAINHGSSERVKSETSEKGVTRSSKFWDRSSENLELRTSNYPSSRLATASSA